jgi:hypothetical protein
MNLAACVLGSLLLSMQPVAHHHIIYATDDPFGGLFDVYGLDVNSRQSVALRFTPDRQYSLGQIRLWLWNSNGDPIPVTVSLREDAALGPDGGSAPSDTPIESWSFEIPHTGLAEPRLFDVTSFLSPLLEGGAEYWIVVESSGQRGVAWAVAQPGIGFGAVRLSSGGDWQTFEGAVGASEVWGTPVPGELEPSAPRDLEPPQGAPCAGDFDGDGAAGAHDVLGFLLAWRAGEAAADFDESGALDTQDAVGFLGVWSCGC